jgi:hypothetical protein
VGRRVARVDDFLERRRALDQPREPQHLTDVRDALPWLWIGSKAMNPWPRVVDKLSLRAYER